MSEKSTYDSSELVHRDVKVTVVDSDGQTLELTLASVLLDFIVGMFHSNRCEVAPHWYHTRGVLETLLTEKYNELGYTVPEGLTRQFDTLTRQAQDVVALHGAGYCWCSNE